MSEQGPNNLKIQLWRPPARVNVPSLHPTSPPALRSVSVSCSKQDVLRLVILQLHAESSSNFHARSSSRVAKSFSSMVKCGLSGARVRRLMMYHAFRSLSMLNLKHLK